jgi:hypothetical protein
MLTGVCAQQQQLILPEMLRWYYKDFLEFSGGEADTDASPPSSSPGSSLPAE